jgi:UDP-N-acetylglucosamine 1-carboxyvinyltransferase
MTSKDSLVIAGGKKLKGTVKVRGAKNAVTKEMVAAMLSSQPSVLHNVPDIADVAVVSEMIKLHGGKVTHVGSGSIKIDPNGVKTADPNKLHQIAGTSRIPILFAGPLLHRLGKAVLPTLGGCEIGPRPVDFHLKALKSMGAAITQNQKTITIQCKKLAGTKIELDYPSVGATEQALLSSVLARGVTEIRNAAIEPEIIDLICVLQKMGAIIGVDTDRVITIQGVEKLHGYEHSVLTDRIEVASWACVAAATDGKIMVEGAEQEPMMTFLNTFRRVGGEFNVTDEGIEFWRGRPLTSITLETDVHPGFMTDWQQPFVVLLTQAEGSSTIHETVYEDRFGFTETLNNMGAKIQLYQECLGGTHCRFENSNHMHSAIISGPTQLHGAEITVPDLRAGFSYIVAALVAKGETKIAGMKTVERGYEKFEEKLRAIGTEIVS